MSHTSKAPEAKSAGVSVTEAPELLIRGWNARVLSTNWVGASLLLVVVVLCAARCFAALIASEDFTTDAFMIFNGAWRIINGQRPHIDFL